MSKGVWDGVAYALRGPGLDARKGRIVAVGGDGSGDQGPIPCMRSMLVIAVAMHEFAAQCCTRFLTIPPLQSCRDLLSNAFVWTQRWAPSPGIDSA